MFIRIKFMTIDLFTVFVFFIYVSGNLLMVLMMVKMAIAYLINMKIPNKSNTIFIGFNLNTNLIYACSLLMRN